MGLSRAQYFDAASLSRLQPCPVTANSDSDDYSNLYPTLGGGLFRAALVAASSSIGAGLATPENASPPTLSVVTVSVPLLFLHEVRI